MSQWFLCQAEQTGGKFLAQQSQNLCPSVPLSLSTPSSLCLTPRMPRKEFPIGIPSPHSAGCVCCAFFGGCGSHFAFATVGSTELECHSPWDEQGWSEAVGKGKKRGKKGKKKRKERSAHPWLSTWTCRKTSGLIKTPGSTARNANPYICPGLHYPPRRASPGRGKTAHIQPNWLNFSNCLPP